MSKKLESAIDDIGKVVVNINNRLIVVELKVDQLLKQSQPREDKGKKIRCTIKKCAAWRPCGCIQNLESICRWLRESVKE